MARWGLGVVIYGVCSPHSRCCGLRSLLPGSTVWMLANFLMHNAEKTALFWKSPVDKDTSGQLNPAWFLASVPSSPPLPATPGFLIFQSPFTLSFLVGHIWNNVLFPWSSLYYCLNFKSLVPLDENLNEISTRGNRHHLSHGPPFPKPPWTFPLVFGHPLK